MTLRAGLCRIIVAWFLLLALGLPRASAQSVPPALPANAQPVEIAPPSPNDLKELIRLLDDERIRNWLEKGAQNSTDKGSEQSNGSGDTLRAQLTSLLKRTRERGRLLQGVWNDLAKAPAHLAQEWQRNLTGSETVRSLTYVLIFLFIGGGFEWLYRQYTNNRLLRLQLSIPKSLSDRLRSAILRALLIFGGLVVFSMGSIGGFLSFEWSSFVEALVLNLLILVIALRTISTLSMFVLAPRVRELRLAPFESSLAKQIHLTLIFTLSAMATSLVVSDVFSRLTVNEIQIADVQAASFSVSIFAGLICLLAALIAIWRVAYLLTQANKTETEEEAALHRRKVFNWRTYLSALATLAFGLWLFAATDLMWTVLILGLLPAILGVVRGWVNYFFDEAEHYLLSSNLAPDLPATEQQVLEIVEATGEATEVDESLEAETDERRPYDTLRLITVRFFRFVLVIASVLIVLAAWGTDIFLLAESPTFYGKVSSVVIDLIVAVLIADLIWTWARTSIDHRLADYTPPEGPQAPGPEARMATLLPLLRVMLSVTLVIMVGLSVLSSAGVNIAPLLAGAGVLGVAIGFGAQSLVKDIVSGIFFLIDDAFRIGEYVEIGNLRGVVESMSVRSLCVRHHRGAVHTIPFGELSSLTNYSRDWVIMKMEFRVPFETDVRLVKKIVKRIGAEMLEDPLYKEGFLEPLKSQGVRRMEEFNMVVGVKFMAKPGEQWVIRRDAYQKIVDAFETNGIGLAERNVKVEVVSDRLLSDDEKQAVIGAAQNAIEQQAGPPVPTADEP